MTVYGVITAAIVRKIRVLIAEIRTLVTEATKVEKSIVRTAETEAARIIADAKRREAAIVYQAESEVESLKNDLVNRISKL